MTSEAPTGTTHQGSGTPSQGRRPLLFLFLFCLLAVAPLLFMWLGETLSAQRCLDAGGSLDYERMVCDYQDEHPVPPFHERHRALLIGTLLAIPAAVALWWWGPRLGRNRAG